MTLSRSDTHATRRRYDFGFKPERWTIKSRMLPLPLRWWSLPLVLAARLQLLKILQPTALRGKLPRLRFPTLLQASLTVALPRPRQQSRQRLKRLKRLKSRYLGLPLPQRAHLVSPKCVHVAKPIRPLPQLLLQLLRPRLRPRVWRQLHQQRTSLTHLGDLIPKFPC
jgi:hypothetical protein